MTTTTYLKPLNIVEINVGSLRSITKRQEMTLFLNTNHPDIVLINETMLNQRHNIAFRNYDFIRTDKIENELGRGTGILINHKIKYESIDTTNWKLKTLETSAALIHTTNNPIFIVSAYRYHNGNVQIDTADLDKMMHAFQRSNASHLIIGGDLNAKHTTWGNVSNCNNGIILNQWVQDNAITNDLSIIHSKEPTFYRQSYSSYLDIFIVTNNINIAFPVQHPSLLEILDYTSDHRAIQLMVIPDNDIEIPVKNKMFDFQKTDWKMFNSTLDAELQEVKIPNHRNMLPTEIEDAIELFTSKIRNTINKIVPTYTVNRNTQLPLPQNILKLIQYRKNLRRRWQRNRYNNFDHQLLSNIKCISKIIEEQIINFNKTYWENVLKSVKLDNNTFRNIKKFAGTFKRNTIPPLTIQGPNYTSAISDIDKANMLGRHFEHIHLQNKDIGNAVHTETINKFVSDLSNNSTPNRNFNPEGSANPSFTFSSDRHIVSMNSLNNVLKSRANKKSVGTDEIPNVVLKKLSYKAKLVIAMIFNQIFNSGYYPNAWKCAITIPIHKKGKPPNDPNSYRPIALLPCISKVFECVVKDRLVTECIELSVLPPDQFGFSFGRTTTHPLVKFHNDVTFGLNRRTPTIACSLDVEKAFDTLWIEGLIYKMHLCGFNQHLCQLILKYLKGRTFIVRVGASTSNPFFIGAGVPQGGVLSALLYNIYLADLPKPPNHISPVQRLQYADDTLLYVSVRNLQDGQNRLNSYLTTLLAYYTKWKIKLNVDKSEAIVFKGLNNQHSKLVNMNHKNVKIMVDGQQIILKDHIKYLGVIHQKRPTHISHINYVIEKGINAFNAIRPVLKRTSKLSIPIKLLCYKQLIRPILEYGFAAWSQLSSHQMERLRILERKCLRSCINYARPRHSYYTISNKDLYKAADTERIDSHMCHQAIRLFEKWPDLELLNNCIDYQSDYLDDPNTLYKPPWNIIHLNNNNRLFRDDIPIFYHRRHKTNGNDNLVYSTTL